jgi:hypothetical protein
MLYTTNVANARITNDYAKLVLGLTSGDFFNISKNSTAAVQGAIINSSMKNLVASEIIIDHGEVNIQNAQNYIMNAHNMNSKVNTYKNTAKISDEKTEVLKLASNIKTEDSKIVRENSNLSINDIQLSISP